MDDKEKSQVREERKRILAARKKQGKKEDPLVQIKFSNLEDPSVPGKPSPPLSFAFGPYLFKESRAEEDGEDTALRDGQRYALPISVVNHLNNLQIPVYARKIDPVTGAMTSYIAGYRNRFACTPVDIGSFEQIVPPPEEPETIKAPAKQ